MADHDLDTDAAKGAAEPALEDLLAPVLDLDGDAQAPALAALCARHPEHAERLRSRYRVLERFGLASDDGELTALTALTPPTARQLPERFGPFRIERLLGRGGMGVVWLAEDTELGRRVALKLIRPEFLDSERARERFRREVAAAAKLDHPGICTVYGAGEIDGQPYLALRYLDGESLEAQLRAARAADRGAWQALASRGGSGSSGRLRPIDLRPAVELVEKLCRAVHVAHAAGLVHRDLKPGNVMVLADGQPVLMDFGLARDAAASAGGLTQSSDPVGTPAYMAPEQVRGDSVDRRTDVHALGALAYECLTLRPPFPGRDREQLYRRILHDPPLELRQLQPAASRDLATVVHKALAKDKARRYGTALELAWDLRRVLDGQPTIARPPGPIARGLAFVRRHRAVSAVAAALAVGLGLALLFLLRSLAAEARSFAVALVTRAHEVRPEDPELAYLVLRRALDVSPEPEVIAAIHDVLPELQDGELVREVPGRVEWVERSPTGRWFVVSGQDIPTALHGADGSFRAELPTLYNSHPAMAFSPDEDELVGFFAADGFETLRFDLTSENPSVIGPPLDHPNAIVGAAAWSRNDTILLTFPFLGRARLYRAASGELAAEIEFEKAERPHQGGAFLPDGRIVLPGGIWSADGSRQLVELPVTDQILQIAVHGDRIAIGDVRGVRVYDDRGVELGDTVRDVIDRRQYLTGLQWSPAGDAIAVSFHDGRILLLDREGQFRQSWSVHTTDSYVARPHFTPDGRHVLTGDWHGQVSVWDRHGQLVERWYGNQLGVRCAPIGPDGASVLIGSWDHTVRIWHRRGIDGVPVRAGFPRADLLRLPSGGLVVGSADGIARLLDRQGEVEVERKLPQPGPLRVHAHLDGRSAWLIHVETGSLWHWQPAAGDLREYGSLPPPERTIPTVAHLASDRLVLGAEWPWHMRTLDLTRREFERNPGVRTGLAVALPGGRGAVTHDPGDDEHFILLLSANGDVVERWRDLEARAKVASLAVSDDGRLAAIGREDGAVTLWELPSQRAIARWHDHQTRVISIAFSPDGAKVATVVSSGHLVIRALLERDPLLVWRSETETLLAAAFADDDTPCTSGSAGLRWWRWDPVRLTEALDRVHLDPTPEQQRRLQVLLRRK